MRVLFINSIGRNKWGGGEKWMINAAKGLKAKGMRLRLLAFQILNYKPGRLRLE